MLILKKKIFLNFLIHFLVFLLTFNFNNNSKIIFLFNSKIIFNFVHHQFLKHDQVQNQQLVHKLLQVKLFGKVRYHILIQDF